MTGDPTDHTDHTDHTLYSRFLSGDAAAYDGLMIRHGDSLVLYLNGYLHDWQDAEDLMIEAFARIMVKKPKIAEGCFRAYLYKTGRNLALRLHSRKSRVQPFRFEALPEDEGRELVEERLHHEERRRALYLCLGRIDPAFREALWLVYFEEMRYNEAARVMGVSPKKIDNLLSRGKQALRREMEKEGIRHAYE